MKNRTSINRLTAIKIMACNLLLSVVFYACHDTRSFESVRNIRNGMTIKEIETYMGEPISYEYINDSSEWRSYVYDNAENGIDKHIKVIYGNGRVTGIKNY